MQNNLRNQTLLIDRLASINLPCAEVDGRRQRLIHRFFVCERMAVALLEAFTKVQGEYPNGFTTLRTFLTDHQQQELYARHRTGQSSLAAAPCGFSAREIGRAIDITFADEFTQVIYDDEYDDEYGPLAVEDLQRIMQPLGFVNVTDGRVDVRDVWKIEDGVLHLEYWQDILKQRVFTQTWRDQQVTAAVKELYR